MKVKIITIHDPDVNYGSTLQSCGTFNYVRQKGYDVQIIDYRPNYKTLKQKLKRIIAGSLFFKAYVTRRNKINGYFRQHASLTPKYSKYSQLRDNPPEADVYITGSDVIWNRDVNSEGGDSAYYLGFVKKGFKMSYAPSMGEIQSDRNIAFIAKQVKGFQYLSVREEISKDQLEQYGLQSVACVLDPVFLMDYEYYKHQTHEVEGGNYTLVYLMSDNPLKRSQVESLSQKYGERVIALGGFKEKCNCDRFIRDAGVEDFLSLILHANHIITDSFHCVAFSLIFKKDFLYLPSVDSSMRIENLLNYVDLEGRIIRSEEDMKKSKEAIDYEEVENKLAKKISYSRAYLDNALCDFESRIQTFRH